MSHFSLTNGKPQTSKTVQKSSKGILVRYLDYDDRKSSGWNSAALGLQTKGFGAANGFRKSAGNLSAPPTVAGSMSYGPAKSSSDLERIEAEYIKNLQQQVYFLELETNYLREQAQKSAELQPQMSAEAKRMLDKLRELQSELDVSKLESEHKRSDFEVIRMEQERVAAKLKAAEDSYQKEKRMLLDEIVSLKKEKELLDRTLVNKNAQLIDSQQHLEKVESGCRSAENKHRLIESQLYQKDEQLKLLQNTLDDKRAELHKAEEKLHRTEEQYYSSAALVNDRVKEDLREEIQLLQQKMKEMEMNTSQDRLRRSKMSDESGHLVRENVKLAQRIQELKSQLGKKQTSLRRGSFNGQPSQSPGGEISTRNKEHAGFLQSQLEQTREKLRAEQLRVKQIAEQIEEQENFIRGQQLNEAMLQGRVSDAAAKSEATETENYHLRHEKESLIERVDLIQHQLEERNLIVRSLEEKIRVLESKLRGLEQLQGLQLSIQSQKWDEFSHLAETMKTLSHSMIQTTTGQKSRMKSSERLNEYSLL